MIKSDGPNVIPSTNERSPKKNPEYNENRG